MQIALMTASMLDRPWEDALDAAVARGVRHIEACGGGHIPTLHYDPVRLAGDHSELARFEASLEERELTLCTFSCHGNPLHPHAARARSDHEQLAATCQLAHELDVRYVNVLAGLPAGGPEDTTPNWVINSVFPGQDVAHQWQWEERVVPYWTEAARIARDAGVTLCVEPHPADVVHNPAALVRLREEVGPTIAMNFDPSHLWWQGIDPIAAVEAYGDCIRTCHVKDTLIDPRRTGRDGVLSLVDYDHWDERPWAFSTPGYGHSELIWAQLIIALRRAGYDGALSIECEDPFLTPDDTFAASVDLLRRVVPADPAPEVDWTSSVAFSEDVRPPRS